MRGRNLLDSIHNEFRIPIIIGLIILLFVNATGKIGISLLLDKTPEENFNSFFASIDNINPKKTAGNDEKVGLSIYDDNRITANMMYGMGEEEYLVYIFTKDVSIDNSMNNIVNTYKLGEDSLNVYGIREVDLEGSYDSHLIRGEPTLLKMTRDNSVRGEKPVTSITGIYYTSEDVITHLFDNDLSNVDSSVNIEGINDGENVLEVSEDGSLWDKITGESSFFGKLFKDGKLR